MAQIRYGAKREQRSREHEATSAEIWSHAVTAVYETDPEFIAAVLPPPLEPGPEPLARMPAMFFSVCVATTPSSVTWPLSTMI